MDMNDELKKITRHGTTTVGMVCSDGIVLAADKRVTLGGMFVAHKKFDKVIKVTDNLALTVAGSVSEAQLVVRLLQAELKLKSMRTGTVANVNEAVNLLGTIVYQNIRKFSPIVAITGFVVGGVDDRGFHLYEVGPDGSIMKHDDFIADGSGMMMAFGVFETLYKKDMKVSEGVALAVKAVNSSIQRDTASGEGVDVFTITKAGVQKVFHKQIERKLEM
jgi:proteasome beta subunit